MMVFNMPLVVIWIGQFCRDVIDRCSDWSVVVLICLLLVEVCQLRLRSCVSCL